MQTRSLMVDDSTPETQLIIFLPKFTAISTPKPSDPNYEMKMKSHWSVNLIELRWNWVNPPYPVSVSAAAWLRDNRPKVAIYPHQVDYCDFCTKVKEIHAIQQTINRLHQSGSSSVEEITQSEDDKKEKTALLEEHLDQAKESLKYYREMKERCSTQWKKIEELQQLPTLSSEQRDELQHLKNTFTLVISADYRMNKLLLYWGRSPQPGSTYYLQKLSYDNLGIVDHRNERGHLHLFSELMGPKNTNHTFSYLLHYLKCIDKVPRWIKRVHVFLDNAGSTNKRYMMGSVFECVQHDILNYFCVSFMIAGHTKFTGQALCSLCKVR